MSEDKKALWHSWCRQVAGAERSTHEEVTRRLESGHSYLTVSFTVPSPEMIRAYIRAQVITTSFDEGTIH